MYRKYSGQYGGELTESNLIEPLFPKVANNRLHCERSW